MVFKLFKGFLSVIWWVLILVAGPWFFLNSYPQLVYQIESTTGLPITHFLKVLIVLGALVALFSLLKRLPFGRFSALFSLIETILLFCVFVFVLSLGQPAKMGQVEVHLKEPVIDIFYDFKNLILIFGAISLFAGIVDILRIIFSKNE